MPPRPGQQGMRPALIGAPRPGQQGMRPALIGAPRLGYQGRRPALIDASQTGTARHETCSDRCPPDCTTELTVRTINPMKRFETLTSV